MITIPGRIPLHIHPFFWVIISLIGWMNSNSIPGTLIWAFVISVSIIVHEFGHALAAVAFGHRAEINLVGMGGLTSHNGPTINKFKQFFIVFNGPFFGLLLFFILWQIQPYFQNAAPYLKYALKVGIQVNLFWTLLNLLPVIPLDGGQMMRIFLEGVFGIRGLKIAITVSLFFAVVLGIYFMVIQQLFLGAIFFMFAFEGYREWNEFSSISPQDTQPKLQQTYQNALNEANAGKNYEALREFSKIREQTQSGVLFISATQESARILAQEGNYKQAYEILAPIRNKLAIEYLVLLQNLAYRLEEWEHAAQIGTLAYQKQPSHDVAILNALAFAIMGQARESVGWLRCLIQTGYPAVEHLLKKREFDAIRQTPEFQNWIKIF